MRLIPVPSGFETSHAEWLRLGGEAFRERHSFGPLPSFYRGRYWKSVKEAVLSSRGFKCCRCNGRATQVHHLNYDFVGEDHLHPEAVVAVCGSCHGLVEYARKAESLVSRIIRRISLYRGFLKGSRGCDYQDEARVCARLIEYQDELAELRKLFSTNTFYSNPRIKSASEFEAIIERFQQERREHKLEAEFIVSTWEGTEKENSKQLLSMLRLEIKNCRQFVAEVFAPVSLTGR